MTFAGTRERIRSISLPTLGGGEGQGQVGPTINPVEHWKPAQQRKLTLPRNLAEQHAKLPPLLVEPLHEV